MKGRLLVETVLLLGLVLHQSVMAVPAAANTASRTAVAVSTEWSVEEWATARRFSPLRPLPSAGKPGDAAFDALPQAQQEAVNRVMVAILKLIAAYERRVVSAPAPFDRYVAGETSALSPAARRGFQHFLRLGCNTCHTSPLFSDDEFHNLNLLPVPAPDPGRAEGLLRLQQSPFRGTGPYADGPPVVRAEEYQTRHALLGSFRTPSLRELVSTAPYGHNGAIATLEEWMEHYVRVTAMPDPNALGTLGPALAPVRIPPQEQHELIVFLRALSSDYHSEWIQVPEGDHPT